MEEEEEERAEPCCRVISLQHGDALCKLHGEIWKKRRSVMYLLAKEGPRGSLEEKQATQGSCRHSIMKL